MNVAFVYYRDWAKQILEELEDTGYEFTTSDEADVILFYGWSKIIPPEVYENKCCLILHPSPLPKYRGGSPIQHQIMNGEKMSAVTILRVGKDLDAGEIYSQTPFSLEGTLDEIFERIVEIGYLDTIKVLHQIKYAKLKPIIQDESQATIYKRRKPEESELTLKDLKNKSAEELNNFIRALSDPYPNAYIVCKDGKKLYLTGSHL